MKNYWKTLIAHDKGVTYRTKKLLWWSFLLSVGKLLCVIALFLSSKVLRTTPIIYFLWGLSVITGIILACLHWPISPRRERNKDIILKIFKYSFIKIIFLVLLFHGLSQVGPFRTILLVEHSDVAFAAFIISIFQGAGGPGKLRGSLWIILGILSLILFDNDAVPRPDHPEGYQHNEVQHILYYFKSWTGLSDHEGGIVVLLLSSLVSFTLNYYGRIISPKLIGGYGRLYALSWIAMAIILTPVAFIVWMFKDASIGTSDSSFAVTILLTTCVAFLLVLQYCVCATCYRNLPVMTSSKVGSLASFFFAFLLSILWPIGGELPQHGLSVGLVLTLILFCIGTLQLTSMSPRHDSLPYVEDSEIVQFDYFSSKSIWRFISSTIRTILDDKNSRTIFYFLCVNFGFTVVELIYGMVTNSLGLISDGFHMLFDCSALVMGLCASVIAQWNPTKKFPYGYGRIEVLSGFVNGLFLSIIGVMVFIEAVERLFEPPPIKTENLLPVAVCGLLVNLGGIVAFSLSSHGHSHGGNHGHSHGHSHNENMQGVFLHVLADTLGSVAVIVSTLLIEWYGWLISDPICSIVLSCLILTSVFPLLKNSVSVLLLKVPQSLDQSSKDALNAILRIDGVLSYEDPNMWLHCGGVTVSNITIYAHSNASEQLLLRQVYRILCDAGFTEVTVQINVAAEDGSEMMPKRPLNLGIGIISHQIPISNSNYDYIPPIREL